MSLVMTVWLRRGPPECHFRSRLVSVYYCINYISYYSKFYKSLAKNYFLPKIPKTHPKIYKSSHNIELCFFLAMLNLIACGKHE